MGISIYLILLIVLLIFNLVFWLLVIWFRILFDCDFGRCCCRTPSAEDEEPIGHRNLGFIDHEDILGRPSTITERMESPPSYEEALKYDQFGFHVVPPPPPVHTTPLSVPLSSPPSLPRPSASPPAQDIPSSSSDENVQLPQTTPSRVPDTRSRASTTSSACPLTPIREEEFDDSMPITVVIDCIGVKTSKIVSDCDTKVDLAGGESLHEHSGC